MAVTVGLWPLAFDIIPRGRFRRRSISILIFFPPNRGVDFYLKFLPAKSRGSISILNFFPPN
jgi:hypothetical protein